MFCNLTICLPARLWASETEEMTLTSMPILVVNKKYGHNTYVLDD